VALAPGLGRAAAVALALGASSGGCFWSTTKSEGRALRTDLNKLDARLGSKEDELATQIAELKRVLDEATKLLKRNSADLGADVAAMRDELRAAAGSVAAATAENATLRELLTKLDARLTTMESKVGAPPATVVTAETLWNEAKVAFDAGRFDDARTAYGKLAAQFPNSDRADDAIYFRGQTFFKENRFEDAISEYRKVYEKWPTSVLADDALFRAAEAASSLKSCSEARVYYGLLLDKYASSSLAAQATKNDKELLTATTKKDKTKCTS